MDVILSWKPVLVSCQDNMIGWAVVCGIHLRKPEDVTLSIGMQNWICHLHSTWIWNVTGIRIGWKWTWYPHGMSSSSGASVSNHFFHSFSVLVTEKRISRKVFCLLSSTRFNQTTSSIHLNGFGWKIILVNTSWDQRVKPWQSWGQVRRLLWERVRILQRTRCPDSCRSSTQAEEWRGICASHRDPWQFHIRHGITGQNTCLCTSTLSLSWSPRCLRA